MARPPVAEYGKRMMTQALAVLVMIGVIIYFLYAGNVQPDEPVSFEITVTQASNAVPGQPIRLDVALKLTNNTKDGVALTVPTQCEVFNWFLTDEDKEFVQSKAEEADCPKQTVSTWLDGQHAMNETFALNLDPNRVKPGDYLLFLRYWGHKAIEHVSIK